MTQSFAREFRSPILALSCLLFMLYAGLELLAKSFVLDTEWCFPNTQLWIGLCVVVSLVWSYILPLRCKSGWRRIGAMSLAYMLALVPYALLHWAANGRTNFWLTIYEAVAFMLIPGLVFGLTPSILLYIFCLKERGSANEASYLGAEQKQPGER